MATIAFVTDIAAADEYAKAFDAFNNDSNIEQKLRVIRQRSDIAGSLSALVKGNLHVLVIPAEFATGWILNTDKIPDKLTVEFSSKLPQELYNKVYAMLVNNTGVKIMP